MTLSITPVSIWYQGANVNATQISIRGVYDDLDTSATYYFELLSASNQNLSAGNLQMTGADYANRTDNQSVIDWVVAELSITLSP